MPEEPGAHFLGMFWRELCDREKRWPGPPLRSPRRGASSFDLRPSDIVHSRSKNDLVYSSLESTVCHHQKREKCSPSPGHHPGEWLQDRLCTGYYQRAYKNKGKTQCRCFPQLASTEKAADRKERSCMCVFTEPFGLSHDISERNVALFLVK